MRVETSEISILNKYTFAVVYILCNDNIIRYNRDVMNRFRIVVVVVFVHNYCYVSRL